METLLNLFRVRGSIRQNWLIICHIIVTLCIIVKAERTPFLQCPSVPLDHVSRYPRSTTCSNFTHCAQGIALHSMCPAGLYFNPLTYNCDLPSNIPSCKGDAAKGGPKSSKRLRPIVDEPSYNDCTRRPCNFYPNAEDDDGSTFVFCVDGLPEIKRCPGDGAFDTSAMDCVPKEHAKIWTPPPPCPAVKESGNPAMEWLDVSPEPIVPQDITFHGKFPPNKTLHTDENGLVSIPSPPVTNWGEWSEWLLCPKSKFITGLKVQRDSRDPDQSGLVSLCVICSSPDRNPDSVVEIPYTIKEYEVPNWAEIPAFSCIGGGVAIGFRALIEPNQGPKDDVATENVELICSHGPPAVNTFNDAVPLRGVWSPELVCLPKQVLCGMRVQGVSYMKDTNLVDRDNTGINSLDFRCCSVEPPLVEPQMATPQEIRELIVTCDNSKNKELRKCEFQTRVGIVPIAKSPQMSNTEMFYESLGHNIECIRNELEKLLREGMSCKEECFYPWHELTPTSVVLDPRGVTVSKKVLVPPETKLSLHQVVGQVGYLQAYSNRFVEVIEDVVFNEEYEELREIPSEDVPKAPPYNCWQDGTPINGQVEPSPIDKEKQFPDAPFHRIPQTKSLVPNDKGDIIMSSPPALNIGDWHDWQECIPGTYVKGIAGYRKDTETDRAGVVSLSYSCYSPNMKQPEMNLLNFVTPNLAKPKWDTSPYGVCQEGTAVGAQVNSVGPLGKEDDLATDGFKILCSYGPPRVIPLQDPSDAGGGNPELRGNWSEKLVCPAKHAINAVRVQALPYDVESKMYVDFDNIGIDGVECKCKLVPNPANTCKRKENKILAASCVNNEAIKRVCNFELFIGTARDFDNHEKSIIFHESIGYTIDCVDSALKHHFAAFDCGKCEYTWKGTPVSLWDNVTAIPRTIFVPPKTKIDVFQVTGECGFYKVYTEKFIKITTKLPKGDPTEEPMLVELPPRSDNTGCWEDDLPINGQVRKPAKKRGLKDVPFHGKPESKLLQKIPDSNASTLNNPAGTTNVGQWGPMEECPGGGFVTGMALIRKDYPNDKVGATGIGCMCTRLEQIDTKGSKPKGKEVISGLTPYTDVPNWEKQPFVMADEGGVIGFQLNVLEDQGPNDDIGMDTLKLVPSYGPELFHPYDDPQTKTELKERGIWQKVKSHCAPYESMCGVQIKSLNFSKSNGFEEYDNYGLEDMRIKCCKVQTPLVCIPEEKSVHVATCDNSGRGVQRKCEFSTDFGLARDFENQERFVYFHESVGYTVDCMRKPLEEHFVKNPPCKKECGYPWQFPASGNPSVWSNVTNLPQDILVPAETKIEIYQTIGVCGYYTVYTDNFKAVTTERNPKGKKESPIFLQMYRPPSDQGYCWLNDLPIEGQVRPPAEEAPHKNVPFHGQRPSKSLKRDPTGGSILSIPPVTDFGDWFKMDECHNAKEFVSGIKAVRFEQKKDSSGLIAVSLTCTPPDFSTKEALTFLTPNYTQPKWPSVAEFRCEEGGGIGLQLNSQEDQGPDIDDVAADQLKLICSHGLPAYNPGGDTKPYDDIRIGYPPLSSTGIPSTSGGAKNKAGVVAEPVPPDPDEQIGVATRKSGRKKNQGKKSDQGAGGKSNVGADSPLRGVWTKPQICRPLQALNGLQVQGSPLNKGTETGDTIDNVGINNVRGRCDDVENPAVMCKPSETRDLVARCDNRDSSTARKCVFEVGFSLIRNFPVHNKTIYYMESIGYTLPCIRKDLAQNFAKWPCSHCDYPWNDEWVAKMVKMKGRYSATITVPELTKINVYQVVGHCGYFEFYTDKFIQVSKKKESGSSGDEEPLKTDMVTEPINETCWMETFPISGQILQNPEEIPHEEVVFHKKPASKNQEAVKDGTVIRSPKVTNVGKYLPWKNCSKGSYVVGYSAVRRDLKNDKMGLVALNAYCSNPERSANSTLDFATPNLTKPIVWADEVLIKCRKGGVVGFQLKQQENQGAAGDDQAAMSIRLICSHGPNLNTSGDGNETDSIIGDSTTTPKATTTLDPDVAGSGGKKNKKKKGDSTGKWTTPQICPPFHVISGFQPQALSFMKSSSFKEFDNTAFDNLLAKCSLVPSPAQACTPTEKSVLLASCNNFGWDKPRKCEFDAFIGLVRDYENKHREIDFHESIGYDLECVKGDLEAHFRDDFACVDCQYRWDKPTDLIYDELATIPQLISIPANSKIEYHQVVGECGYFTVYSDQFFQTVYTPTGDARESPVDLKPVNELDRTPDKVCWMDNANIEQLGSSQRVPPHKEVDFHGYPEAKSKNKTEGGFILSNPVVTDVGTWEPMKECPKEWYATGVMGFRRKVEVIAGKKTTVDHAGFTSVALICQPPDRSDKDHIAFVSPNLPPRPWPQYEFFTCEEGAGIGIQLNSQPDQGPLDDVATDDTRLWCSYGEHVDVPMNTSDFTDVTDLRGEWTKEQICKPFHAITGLEVQAQSFSTESNIEEHDNVGVCNVKVKCSFVKNPAEVCIPMETRVHIVTCDNSKGNKKKECKFESQIGLVQDYVNQDRKIYFYESIGYTLPCVRRQLIKHMQDDMKCNSAEGEEGKCEFDWKADHLPQIWDDISYLNYTFEVNEREKVKVYQIISECDYYKVYTNKYVAIKGKNEKPFEIEGHPASPPKGRCWQLNTPIISALEDPPELNHAVATPFLNRPPTKNFLPEQDLGSVLMNPVVTSRGEWTQWERCPEGMYINGVVARRSAIPAKTASKLDQAGVTHIHLQCQNPEKSQRAEIQIISPNAPVKEAPKADFFSCADGTGIGFQVNSQQDQGPGDDGNLEAYYTTTFNPFLS